MKTFVLATLAVAATSVADAAAAEPVKLKLDSGVAVGSSDGGVLAFKGVPFALAAR